MLTSVEEKDVARSKCFGKGKIFWQVVYNRCKKKKKSFYSGWVLDSVSNVGFTCIRLVSFFIKRCISC